jgi:ribosomal protein S12 methylthiotransferase
VDGVVYLKGSAALGQLAKVKIEAADVYDLYGSVL